MRAKYINENRFERRQDPKTSMGIGIERIKNHLPKEDLFEPGSWDGEGDTLKTIIDKIFKTPYYWVGYGGDPQTDEEERIVDATEDISWDLNTISKEFLEFNGTDYGNYKYFSDGTREIVQWFDGHHNYNWFVNDAVLRQLTKMLY